MHVLASQCMRRWLCVTSTRRCHLLFRLGQSSRVEHKVCSNIFVILRLGEELIVKINSFIISIFSWMLSISNRMKVMVCYFVCEMKKYNMKNPFYSFSIWDYTSKNMSFYIHKSLSIFVCIYLISYFSH